jgi:hypothetical protein
MQKILLALILSVFPLLSCYAQVQKKPTSSLEIFPKLPKSSVCTQEKIAGTWKLLLIYEVPSGRELEIYSTLPMQYYIFRSADGRYGDYMGVLQSMSMAQIQNLAIDKLEDLKQYVVNSSGMLFFYRNRIPVDSLACFIVEEPQPPFMRGQLLLMPPEKSSQGRRLLKVYQRVLLEHEVKP